MGLSFVFLKRFGWLCLFHDYHGCQASRAGETKKQLMERSGIGSRLEETTMEATLSMIEEWAGKGKGKEKGKGSGNAGMGGWLC